MRRFADVSSATDFDLPDDGRGIAVSDWDFDGDLDLWMTNRTAPRVRFLRNQGDSANHFISIKLQGDGKSVNRDAIGSRIELYLSASQTPMIRTVRAGESFLSQSSNWVHFGLGKDANIDRIVVRWPGSEAEEIRGALANGFYLINQGSRRAIPWTAPTQRKDLIATQKHERPVESEQARIVVPPGLPLPAIWIVDDAGREAAWSNDGTGPMLINLWATWCRPCIRELSELSQAEERLKQAGIKVVALNTDHLEDSPKSPAQAASLLNKIGFPFPAVAVSKVTVQSLNALQQAVLDRWKPLPLPCSFLVDASGEIVVIYKGPVSVEQLLADQSLLSATPEQRRAAGTPFAGRWVDEKPSRSSPRRVASQLLDLNQIDGALRYLDQIVESSGQPTDQDGRRELGDTLYFLGVLYDHQRQTTEAHDTLLKARDLLPEDVRVRSQLGKILMRMGKFPQALPELTAAVQINPHNLELGQHLGVTLLQLNQLEKASAVLRNVVDANPRNATAWYFLGNAELGSQRFAEAIDAYRKAVAIAPRMLEAVNNLAWILSVHPDDNIRGGEEALALAKRLCDATKFQESRFLDTLAVAYAETEQFDQAVATTRQAIEFRRQAANGDSGEDALKSLQDRLEMFQTRQPYREMSWSPAGPRK